MRRSLNLLRAGGLLLCLLLPGCSVQTAPAHGESAVTVPHSPDDTLVPGVVHRAIPLADGTGIDVIDVDLSTADAHLIIQTRGINLASGRVVGQAFTPHDWLTRLHGLAAVNGGYFGGEDEQGRKEFVGLLVQKGRVRHAAPPIFGQGSATIRRGQYVRSAFGLTAQGKPTITWAATGIGQPQALYAYAGPMGKRSQSWPVFKAVGCGPTLITQGRISVSQSQERLISPGPEPRTFVAYDGVNGQPRHLIFGIASGASFTDLARFLAAYFPRYDSTPAEAAMCLDGGASTQMTYKLNGNLQSPRETGVTVPDALVLLPGR